MDVDLWYVDQRISCGFRQVGCFAHGMLVVQSYYDSPVECRLVFEIVVQLDLPIYLSIGVAQICRRAVLMSSPDLKHFLMIGLMYKISRSMNPLDWVTL